MATTDTRPLMIFAAGLGTRMRPLTDQMPKSLIKVGGIPMIDRSIALGRAAGCAPMVANVHYLADQMSDHLEHRGLVISDERDLIRETGGGLKHARPLLGGKDAYTLNPDVLWIGPNPLRTLAPHWNGQGALLLLVPIENAHARQGDGDFSLKDGVLNRGGPLVYTGAQIIDTSELDQIEEDVFSLNVVWNRLAAQGKLNAVVYPGEWCDLGNPAALDTAEALLVRA